MLIAIALDRAGSHPAAAAAPNGPGAQVLHARYWIDRVVSAERAGFDLVTIEDSPRRPAAVADGIPDPGQLDATMIACRVAPATRTIGILPVVATSLTEPFLVSTQIATLDFVTRGRGGWVADPTTDPDAGGYVGPRPVPAVQHRFAEAAEHVDVVRRLWDSWDDDAEIRDPGAQRFIDRDRIHHIDFTGRFMHIRGPSITPRPPQGQPPVAVGVSDDAGLALAAKAADIVLLAVPEQGRIETEAQRVREAVGQAGRDPSGVRVLVDVEVTVAGAASHRRRRLDAHSAPAPRRLGVTGTIADLAARLQEWSKSGVDGFRLLLAVLADDLVALTAAGADALCGRLADGRAEPPATLRDRLGLSRPDNRFATA